jgi:hypothetical protein
VNFELLEKGQSNINMISGGVQGEIRLLALGIVLYKYLDFKIA